MSNNTSASSDLNSDSEISLIDILRFLKNAWKAIAIFGVLGIAIAIAYLVITPKQYEATAYIAMAQIGAANTSYTPSGVIVEDSGMLILRLSMPTSYPQQTIAACGFNDSIESSANLAESIKLIPTKVVGVVELKTFGKSSEVANACANAIFELIKTTQARILNPYIQEAMIKIADDELRLEKANNLVVKADKSVGAMSAAYLSTRDEIRFLLDEIASLKSFLATNQTRITHLVSPIYVSDKPIGPKKRMVLLAGLLGGIFLGLAFALRDQILTKLKRQF